MQIIILCRDIFCYSVQLQIFIICIIGDQAFEIEEYRKYVTDSATIVPAYPDDGEVVLSIQQIAARLFAEGKCSWRRICLVTGITI